MIGSTIQRRARQTDLLMSQQPQILRTNKDLTIIIKQGLHGYYLLFLSELLKKKKLGLFSNAVILLLN